MADLMATKPPANGGGSFRWLVRLLVFEGFLMSAVLLLVFLPWPWALLAVLAWGVLDFLLLRFLDSFL